MRSKLELAKKVEKTQRRHEQGLLNDSMSRITNACVEGFHNAIQRIKANARESRNFTNYRKKTLPCRGKVNMRLE